MSQKESYANATMTPSDMEKDEAGTTILSPSVTDGGGGGQSLKMPSKKMLKHVNDADEAMKAFEGYEGEVLVLDESMRRKLLRKIDWHLMPVSVLGGQAGDLERGADWSRLCVLFMV